MIKLQNKNGNIDLTQKMFKGDPGGYYTPTVSEDGNLTWSPSGEDMPAVPGSNIAGPEGPAGKSGVWTEDTAPPEGYNVWIAPGGSASDVVTRQEMEDYVAEHGGSGSSGENGATFTPSVSEDGTLSWTNDKGLDNPASVNIMGPQGETGPAGADGVTPVKGTDYWTEEDKTEIVSDVLAALPQAEEVSY